MRTNAPANASEATAPRNGQRRRALLGLAAGFAAIGLAWGTYWYIVDRFRVDTDNAYVEGNVVQITPQVAGTVVAIDADDTDFVRTGQTLVRLDPADARVALDQATAQLAQTVREVRATFVTNDTLQANIATRQAELARARAEVARAEEDVSRRQPLVDSGAVGQEEQQHALSTLAAARAAASAAEGAVAAAREQLTGNRALTGVTGVDRNPNVLRAAARLREAYLAWKRCQVPAPVAGYVAKRSVQVGQRVPAGAPLMAVIPLDQLWVTANFKESQLRDMRIGQPVRLNADLYGSRVEYTGRVLGLGAGTGAVFSLLPAQNATGNWIKVVQRLPVRIGLDPKELAAHPLRVGLSMVATVDVSQQDGPVLAAAPRQGAVAGTTVYDRLDAEADALADEIIAANLATPRAKEAAAGK